MPWFLHSLISMVGFTGIVLLLKALTKSDYQNEIINFYFFLLMATLFLGVSIAKQSFVFPKGRWIFLFVFLAVIGAVGNYYSVMAIREAPNPGYVRAIQTFHVVIVSVLAVSFFGSDLSIRKAIGIILSVVGIILIAL